MIFVGLNELMNHYNSIESLIEGGAHQLTRLADKQHIEQTQKTLNFGSTKDTTYIHSRIVQRGAPLFSFFFDRIRLVSQDFYLCVTTILLIRS